MKFHDRYTDLLQAQTMNHKVFMQCASLTSYKTVKNDNVRE